jgi:hypothetical protein
MSGAGRSTIKTFNSLGLISVTKTAEALSILKLLTLLSHCVKPSTYTTLRRT